MTKSDRSTILIVGNRQIFLNAMRWLKQNKVPTSTVDLFIVSEGEPHLTNCNQIADKATWLSRISLHECKPNIARKKQNKRVAIFRKISNVIEKIAGYRSLFRHANTIQARSHGDKTNIITGFYTHPIERTIAKIFRDHRYFLVDDGNLTLSTNERRLQEVKNNFNKSLFSNNSGNTKSIGYRGIITLLRLFAGINTKGERVLNFVSDLEFEVAIPQDNLISLDKRVAKANKVQQKLVHFLGMPALSRLIIDARDYSQVLKCLNQLLAENHVVYYRHPAETDRDLEPVLKLLKPDLVLRNQQPYEQVYCELDELPSIVISFYSSTVLNLARIVQQNQTRLQAVKLPSELFQSTQRRAAVERIYAEFGGIDQIDIINLHRKNDRWFSKNNRKQSDAID